MGLRELLGSSEQDLDRTKLLYEQYGFIDNPFPDAGRPSGNPHMEGAVDETIAARLREFESYDVASQVISIVGTHGVGKTNLLNYYQEELKNYYWDKEGFYIIRYYPDPEPYFDAIVRKVFQAFGETHLQQIGNKLKELNEEKSNIIGLARNPEIKIVLQRLYEAAENGNKQLQDTAAAAMEWLIGLRVLKKHKDLLKIDFRLDTIESKTQALRDIVCISHKLGILKGIFLLLDELEKHDISRSKTEVIHYLQAIRALIDALPQNLFLMLAMTPDARRRYFEMIPAIAGRLQNSIELYPLQNESEAVKLCKFYIKDARIRAEQSNKTKGWRKREPSIFSDDEVFGFFSRLFRDSADRGLKGVSQRDFLNALHQKAEKKFSEISERSL